MSRRRRHSSPAPALPLEDEDLLQEILLRLPPKPSALPRASLVCKRWRGILSDPHFLGRYRRHHRKPPLLGFITGEDFGMKYDFVPLPRKKPDRIPAARFLVPNSSSSRQRRLFLGCRHGLASMLNVSGQEVVVWDPLTGRQRRVPFRLGLRNFADREGMWMWHAAVLCADTEEGHAHGDCILSPFKLVLTCGGRRRTSACLYESASGVWADIVSLVNVDAVVSSSPSILIGNAVYWLLYGGNVLAFDIERQALSVIEKPADAHRTDRWSFQLLRMGNEPADAHRTDRWSFQLLRMGNDSGLGLAVMSTLSIHLWERKLNADGVVGWVLPQKTIPLEVMFQRRMRSDQKEVAMVGYDEESNVIILATLIGDFMLLLDSNRFIQISERNCGDNNIHYAYSNFYTAVSGFGWKWLDLKL